MMTLINMQGVLEKLALTRSGISVIKVTRHAIALGSFKLNVMFLSEPMANRFGNNVYTMSPGDPGSVLEIQETPLPMPS